MPNIKDQKKKIRDDVQANLRQKAGQGDPNAPLKVRDHFLSYFKNLDPRLVIAGTSSLPHELSPMPLMEALQKRGHALCLPVTGVRATPLLFRAYKIGDALNPNVWNIGVPKETEAVLVPDVLLCPMVAFDRSGARLGYGGGYYDATLQSLRAQKNILAIGLAYAAQEVAIVPTGHHDQKLDAVITEKEVIVTNRQR